MMNIYFLKSILLQVTMCQNILAGRELWNGNFYEVLEGEACLRKCPEPRDSKICEFNFEVGWWHTMTQDCLSCPHNVEDCFNKNCITADGTSRLVQLVNKQLPGPSIQVCEGDVIRVKVENKLLQSAGLSIHWHGIHQRSTPSSDGVPYVTQYYIDSGMSMVYEFVAEPAGTHYWHSHSGMELADGVGGPLIVRRPIEMEENAHLYDEDLAAHHVFIQGWSRDVDSIIYLDFVTNSDSSLKPLVSFLVNGKSQRIVYGDDLLATPLTTYTVKQGKRYRFRLIYASTTGCSVALYIDQHQMLVIATELGSIEPITVDVIVLKSGQRYDIVIDAKRPIGKYYISVVTTDLCNEDMDMPSRAVLEYEGAEPDSQPFEPRDLIRHAKESDLGQFIMLNSISAKWTTGFIDIPISKVKMIENSEDSIRGHADKTIYLMTSTEYPGGVENQLLGISQAFLNYIVFKPPPIPLISMDNQEMREYACNAESLAQAGVNCSLVVCECTHLYHVKLGSLVEIHLLPAFNDAGAHPMHLHGNSFYVIGEGILEKETSIEAYKAMDKAGLLSRNFVKPPKMDTIAPHEYGYAILRFRADNPGWWIFHCHIEYHIEWGMSVVLVVDDDNESC